MKLNNFVIIGLMIIFIVFLLFVMVSGLPSQGKDLITSVPVAEATYPPEAVNLGNKIREDMAKYASGAVLVTKGEAMMQQAATSAKGRDLILCSDFGLRLDRENLELVVAEDCYLY